MRVAAGGHFTVGRVLRRWVALCVATSACGTQDVGVVQTQGFPEGGSAAGGISSGGAGVALPIVDAGLAPGGGAVANGGATNGGTASEIAGAPSMSGAPSVEPPPSRCDVTPIACNAAGSRLPFHRALTPEEYEYSVLDLFGVTIDAVEPFPYATGTSGSVPELSEAGRAELGVLAREIAVEWAGDPDAVLGCVADEAERECVERFIEERAPLVFRGALADDERDLLLSTYDDASAGKDDPLSAGLEEVLVSLLTSPRFVIVSTLGRGRQGRGGQGAALPAGMSTEPSESLAALSGFELASRLSYWLWLSAPDRELFRLAASDELMQPDVLRVQAERLLGDPKATRAIDAFYDERFQLWSLAARANANANASANTGGAPNDSLLTPELAVAMHEETKLLARELYLQERSFAALFTASHTYANEALRVVYGDEITVELGDEHERVELPPERRPGLLTRGAWLAAYGRADGWHAPVRGNQLLRQACGDIGAVDDHPFLVLESVGTARQNLAAAIDGPSCVACHGYIDPPGLGFEVFDEVGRYGETQAGMPIETAGELRVSSDATLAFDDVPDLMRQLAESSEAYGCLAEQWLGRISPWLDAGCSVRQVTRATCETGDLVQMLAELATTEAFRFIVPVDGEVSLEEGCAAEGSHDCAYLAEHTGVDLGECQEFQSQACDPEAADGHPYFPCIGGITVIRGCCSDDECNRVGAARFCGQGVAPHGVCVTTDAF